MAELDSNPPASSSPPRTPGLLRRTTTPTSSPWLNRLLSPFVSSASSPPASSSSPSKAKAMAKAALRLGPMSSPQVDEGFFESDDDPATHFGPSCRSRRGPDPPPPPAAAR